MLLATELAARQAYWRCPPLRAWVSRRRSRRRRVPQVADRETLRSHLRRIGVADGELVMAHTSVSGLRLTDGPADSGGPADSLSAAKRLLEDLLNLVGETGTLVMPTHAVYQDSASRAPNGKPSSTVYDPTATPCGTGLVNELFWRSPGVQRSLYPYNTLAAKGPLAAELLRDNLNDRKPLPHGVDSGYYRLCQRNGLIVGIGVPLGRYMTLMHTAEDVRNGDWPIPDFFEEKRYIVRVEGVEKEWTVRQRRSVYGKFCLCMRKFVRDLLREGILHEGLVGGVRVDWARAGDVFEFLMQRNRTTPYPYYGIWSVKTCK